MLAFLMCVERGNLENQALLLCRSIRRFGGRFRDAPIHTFQPRSGTEVSTSTLAELQRLGATHWTLPLNAEFAAYAFGNKIFCCAWAEKSLSEDLLVFLDSDTCMVGEPTAFDFAPGVDAAVRPVDRKRQGSSGPGDPNEDYWRKMYRLLDVTSEPLVTTSAFGERIRAYVNAGLIVVRRSAGIFYDWRAAFLRLMATGHVPAAGMTFMDQLALAAVLARRWPKVALLDDRYNYPLPLRVRLQSPWRESQLSNLVHIHYHRWFNQPGFLRRLVPTLDPDDPVGQWLDEQLPFLPHLPIDQKCNSDLDRRATKRSAA